MSLLVTTHHPDYDRHFKQWCRNEDAYKGRVKEGRNAEIYLKKPNICYQSSAKFADNSRAMQTFEAQQQAAEARYSNDILPNALYFNFTQPTVETLVGAIMRKPPKMTLSSRLAYLEDDVDGKGSSVGQQARETLEMLCVTGRGFLVVDMPRVADASRQDNIEGKVAPRIKTYTAKNCINWDTITDGSLTKLSLIVFEELYKSTLNVFTHEYQPQQLVYRLDNGAAVFEKYRDGEIVDSDFIMVNGSTTDTLPVFPVGANDNDICPDVAPMTPIVEINLSHYVQYAQYRESIRIAGQPQYAIDIGEMSDEDYKKFNPLGFVTGSAIPMVTKKGSVNLLQFQANDAAATELTNLEKRALSIGAGMLQESSGNETATAARIRSGAQVARMSAMANNVGDAYYNALVLCDEMMGGNGSEIEFALNDSFFDAELVAQDIVSLSAAIMQGNYTRESLFMQLKQAGHVAEEMTFEEWDALTKENDSVGGLFNG